MKKLVLSVLVFVQCMAFSQVNFGIRQELEKGTSFGYVMAVDGKTMMVGATDRYTNDVVKVYTKQWDGSWKQSQTLQPSDKPTTTKTSWHYGYRIALQDSIAVVSAVHKDLFRKDAGAAYFYKKGKDGLWKEEHIAENPYAKTTSGYSYYAGKNIAVCKNKVSISHDNGTPTFVHIYERAKNGTWSLKDTINAGFSGLSGLKVDFKDSLFTAMSFEWYSQEVHEYKLKANGTWIKNQVLMAEKYPDYNTYFGQLLSIDGNQMAVCAASNHVTFNGDSLPSAGKVFMYERKNGIWGLKQELTAPVPAAGEQFGVDAVVKGDTLVISSLQRNTNDNGIGAVYIYLKKSENWELQQKFQVNTSRAIGVNLSFVNGQVISYGWSGVYVLENLTDCQGVKGGPAKLNSCKICYGGTTGLDSLSSEQKCITAVEEIVVNRNIQYLSPNPFQHEYQLQLPKNASATLIDAYGRVLYKYSSSGVYSVSDVKPGVYFMLVEGMEGHVIQKVIKE